MKAFKKTAFLAVALSVAVAGLAGCKSNAKMPLTFVAVTSDTYNAAVTIGDYSYKFQGKFNEKNNTFTLDAITQGKASSSGGGRQGPGGGGFPGGGGNSSGPAFEGFGAGEEQPGGDQGGDQGQQGGFPGGDQGQQGGFPGGDQGGQQGGDQGQQGGFPGGDQGGQQGGDQGQQGGFPGGDQGQQGGDQGQQGGFPGGDQGGQQGGDQGQQGGFPGGDQGGQQGPGGPGGDQQQGETSAEPAEDTTDYSQYDFSISGSYVFEKGYGYKISLDDANKTVIHTDFDKIEGRHEFYYSVAVGDKSSLVHFQAKDPTFKNQLADGYKKWDERDSTYIFYAKATGNNNSVATAYMYLHGSDHSVVVNTPSGANRDIKYGMTWEEKDGAIVVHNGDENIVADKTLPNAEHQGYRLVYSSNTYYCSLNPEVKWKKLTIADFEGANTHEFVGSYTTSGPDGGEKAVNLNLVEDGKAKLYLGSSTASFVGSWEKDSANKLTIVLDGKTGEFELGQDNKYSITIRVSVSSFFGSSTETIVLTQQK